jgi:hypothetical protein
VLLPKAYSPKCLEKLSERGMSSTPTAAFGPYTEAKMDRKVPFRRPVRLRRRHLRDFSDGFRSGVPGDWHTVSCINLAPGTAGTHLSHSRRRSGDHKILGAEYTCDLINDALTPDRPLQAHFWCPVVQSGAKMQPAFRSNRNHYTHTSPVLHTPRPALQCPAHRRSPRVGADASLAVPRPADRG